MAPYFLTFLLLSSGMMQVGVRTPAGSEHVAEFPNTEAGVKAFERWVSATAKLKARSPAHSCLASQSEGDAPLYTSPFLAFTYDLQGYTAVWSEALFQVAYPTIDTAQRTASLMFSHCRTVFGRT